MHALTTTVTDARINGGAPTNIPLIVPGQVGTEILWRRGPMSRTQYEIAVANAMKTLARGESLPWFASIELAVQAAKDTSAQAREQHEAVIPRPSHEPGLRPMLDVPPSVSTLSPEAVRPLPPRPDEHEPVQFFDTMLAGGPGSTMPSHGMAPARVPGGVQLFGGDGMRGDPSVAVQAMEWFKRQGIPDNSGDVPPGIPNTQDQMALSPDSLRPRAPEQGPTVPPRLPPPPGLIPLELVLPQVFGQP